MNSQFLKSVAQLHPGHKSEFSEYRFWYQLYLLGCWSFRKFLITFDPLPGNRSRYVLWLLIVGVAGFIGGMLPNPLTTAFTLQQCFSAAFSYGVFLIASTIFFVFADGNFPGCNYGCPCIGVVFVPTYRASCDSVEIFNLTEQALFANVIAGAYLGGMLSIVAPEWSTWVECIILGAVLNASVGALLARILPRYKISYLKWQQRMWSMGMDFGGPD